MARGRRDLVKDEDNDDDADDDDADDGTRADTQTTNDDVLAWQHTAPSAYGCGNVPIVYYYTYFIYDRAHRRTHTNASTPALFH